MKLVLLLLSIILSIKYISAIKVPGYGIWNGEENNIIIGKLDLSLDGPSYSTIFMLENNTLANSYDKSLSTYNKETNTIYFFTNNINNNDSGYLYSYNLNSNELKLIVEYSKSHLQFYAIESDHSTSDLDLFIIYKDSSYIKDSFYCGALSQIYGVPALYGEIQGQYLSSTFSYNRQTFDVLSLTKDNNLLLASFILLGINVNNQQLQSTNFKIDSSSSTGLLSYSLSDSSIYGIMNVKGTQQLVNIKSSNISLLNWMNINNSKVVKQFSAMGVQNSYVYQSVIYFDNSFGINLLNSKGLAASIETPFLINNFWFI